MGQSGPAADGGYRFVDHARYLDTWFDTVLPGQRIVLVLHDWGSALGFWWAFARPPPRVPGLRGSPTPAPGSYLAATSVQMIT